MTSEVAALLNPYRGRGLLLDANLLLVLVIGHADPLQIPRHKKTRGDYVAEDYDLLFELIGVFAPCFTTPHILTEVSNQLGQGEGPHGRALYQSFTAISPMLREHYTPCQELVSYDRFPDFGLTDMGIRHLATSERILVMTADSPLAASLGSIKIDVIDYKWIRTADRGW